MKLDNASRRRARTALATLAAAALATGPTVVTSAASAASPTRPLTHPAGAAALSAGGSFRAPSAQAKPMARTWFPDAGAGRSKAGLALVAKQVRELAAGGFGGAEIAFLSDNTNYDNAQAKHIGFGTPNWQGILKTILHTANSIPGGFKIDLTITSHWPLAIDTIDPNDDSQQQEAVTAYSKITAADLSAGTVGVPMPAERTQDFSNNANLIANFLFVNKFTSANIAKVVSLDSNGNPVFQLSSLASVNDATARQTVSPQEAASGVPYHTVNGVRYAGYAAGVPSKQYAEAHGIDYAKVLAQWGPAAAPGTKGEIDAQGNRKRMADWQYLYQTDLNKVDALKNYTPSSGDALAVGDYVLVGSYHRGTGQVMSGGSSVTQYARPYAVSLYNTSGVDAIKAFYRKKILDPELIALLRENAAKNPSDAMFEDSLEMRHDYGPLWDSSVLSVIHHQRTYDALRYAPLFALGSSASFDDTAQADRMLEDYSTAMGVLWRDNHIAGLKRWAAGFGYKYKMQPEGGAVGVSGAEASLGVEEGDNAATSDGYRNLAAAANISGTNLLSLEGLTFEATAYSTTWQTLARALNGYWAGGVNRVNFHGSPFPKTFNHYNSSWPGWVFGFGPFAFGAFDNRQIYWHHMNELSAYVARTQAVLQSGKAKVDVAVLEGSPQRYQLAGGTAFPSLLNAGYSYNILDESMLNLPGMAVHGRVLDSSGPAFKALVVNNASELSVDAVNTLINYARAGLPVVLYNSDLSRVYGTNTPGNNDQLLAQRVAVLRSLAPTLSTGDAVAAYLNAHGARSAVRYNDPGLEAIHRAQGSGNAYYLFSSGTSLIDAAAAGDSGIRVADPTLLHAGQRLILDEGANREIVTVAAVSDAPSGPNVTLTAPLTKAHAGAPASGPGPSNGAQGAGVSTVLNTPVTLTGSGTPYLLNAYTGAATPIRTYSRDGNTVTVRVSLNQADSTIIALVPAARCHVRAAAAVSSATATSLNDGWTLHLQSWGPGNSSYDPRISSKTTVTFTNVSLGSWSDLPATAAQLSALGVDSMSSVAGEGRYTRSFQLPANWRASNGGYLTFGHLNDMIVGVVVNGHRLPMADLFTDTVNAAPYLHPGQNSISVTIDTTLNNRVPGHTSTPYGLTSVTLSPDGQLPVNQ